MAKWYVQAKAGEDWRSVSDMFAGWILASGGTGDFGWSEGDPVALPSGDELLCFAIPDHHGRKVRLFETWAKTTDRVYGYADGSAIRFPENPGFVVELPVVEETPAPPWLRSP